MGLEIVCALAQGCEGIYVYTGRGMDGHFYSAAARAVQRAALLEEFTTGTEVLGRVTLEGRGGDIAPEQMPYTAYAKLFEKGRRRLLLLAGLDFKRSFPLVLRLPGLTGRAYRIKDAVSGKLLGQKEVWGGEELQKGVEVTLGPGDLYTYVITGE